MCGCIPPKHRDFCLSHVELFIDLSKARQKPARYIITLTYLSSPCDLSFFFSCDINVVKKNGQVKEKS